MNLANKLTILRIILVPIMVIFAYLPLGGDVYGVTTSMIIMEAIFIIASITDKLDGYIARSRNQVTTFGKVIAASVWGKLKTVTQIIALIFAFIDNYGFFAFVNGGISGLALAINVITSVMMAISVVATVFSGWNYLASGKDLFKE